MFYKVENQIDKILIKKYAYIKIYYHYWKKKKIKLSL